MRLVVELIFVMFWLAHPFRLHHHAMRRSAKPARWEFGAYSSEAGYNGLLDKEYAEEDGIGERVVRLIDRVNESISQGDLLTPLWDALLYEASTAAEDDLVASVLVTNAILSQRNFDDAVINYVANHLDTPLFPATQIRNLFAEVCEQNSSISSAWALDLIASAIRDNGTPNTLSVLLFNKSFHALVTYRVAHSLWQEGREGLAKYFQSLSSRAFSADIHPACCIGQGCFVSSGSGIVIGETASVGNECSIMHGVTLGGTGKESGDRHPKVGNGVFIAAGATVLGNIEIGDGSVINAGSVVVKPVPAFTRVGGVPAKFICTFEDISHFDPDVLSMERYEEDPSPAMSPS
jgi:serine O-acetyltransferase